MLEVGWGECVVGGIVLSLGGAEIIEDWCEGCWELVEG